MPFQGCCCCQCVREMNAGVVECCGKYHRVVPAGFYCLKWPFQEIRAMVSLKIQQMLVNCDTKTKDNVFVRVIVAVQYQVVVEKVPSAYYKLSDPASQISSYVNDVVRSSLPRMNIDEAFAAKDQVAEDVKKQLTELMSEYGYLIVATLVTDLDPNVHVKSSMNDINAQMRLREAAAEKAEADKILLVKAAEADAESKYLSGLGVAKQRKAIVDGLSSTVNEFSATVEGAGPREVMDLLLVTQYFDMLREVGTTGRKGSTIFLPHGPQAVQQLRQEMAQEVKNR